MEAAFSASFTFDQSRRHSRKIAIYVYAIAVNIEEIAIYIGENPIDIREIGVYI